MDYVLFILIIIFMVVIYTIFPILFYIALFFGLMRLLMTIAIKIEDYYDKRYKEKNNLIGQSKK